MKVIPLIGRPFRILQIFRSTIFTFLSMYLVPDPIIVKSFCMIIILKFIEIESDFKNNSLM